MGRLVYEKGIQNLIAAMPKILEHYNDAKLVVAGKGGMIDELRNQVNFLGLGNKVYFTGYIASFNPHLTHDLFAGVGTLKNKEPAFPRLSCS